MRVLVCDPIAEDALNLLKQSQVEFDYKPEITGDQLVQQVSEYDALIVRSRTKVTRQVFTNAKKLRVVGRAGVGIDNIDSEAANERHVKILNTPNALTNAVAEFTIGLMLELSRSINKADASMKEGKWSKSAFHGIELRGKVYGTIGIGRIGQRVTEIAHGFGMKIMANDVIPIPQDLIKKYDIKVSTQEEVLAQADFVDLHVPLTNETTYLVNYEKLRRMKKSAYLINTARGKIVNERDLLRALDEGIIAGAALDVFEMEPPTQAELLKHQKVILTPHIAGQTREAQSQAGLLVVEEVLKHLKQA